MFLRFTVLAGAAAVLHLYSHFANHRLGTVGQICEILYTFAPYLTSSYCPQNNSVVIGFRYRGGPKPCGPAQESQEGTER